MCALQIGDLKDHYHFFHSRTIKRSTLSSRGRHSFISMEPKVSLWPALDLLCRHMLLSVVLCLSMGWLAQLTRLDLSWLCNQAAIQGDSWGYCMCYSESCRWFGLLGHYVDEYCSVKMGFCLTGRLKHYFFFFLQKTVLAHTSTDYTKGLHFWHRNC